MWREQERRKENRRLEGNEQRGEQDQGRRGRTVEEGRKRKEVSGLL